MGCLAFTGTRRIKLVVLRTLQVGVRVCIQNVVQINSNSGGVGAQKWEGEGGPYTRQGLFVPSLCTPTECSWLSTILRRLQSSSGWPSAKWPRRESRAVSLWAVRQLTSFSQGVVAERSSSSL